MGVSNLIGPSGGAGSNGSSGALPSGFSPAFSAPTNDASTGVPDELINYNERFADAAPAAFRDRVIEQTMSALIGKTKPNAMLIGPAGVGKTRIVEEIARRIAAGHTLLPTGLREATIYELPLTSLVAGTMYRGQLEQKVKNIIAFASAPENKAILFIDEIHQLGSNSASHDEIAQALKPALARGDINLIGATTTQEARTISRDPALQRRFTRVIVDELTADQTESLLSSVRDSMVSHYNYEISVADSVLPTIVTMADQFGQADSHRPDSAITLLDRAMAERVLEQQRLIAAAEDAGDQDTVDLLRSAGSVPLTARRVEAVAKRLITGHSVEPKLDVDHLRDELNIRLLGQSRACDGVVDLLERRSLGLFETARPTTLVFAGPSGVGKTEAAKIIAEQATGQAPIILSMSEYNDRSSKTRLLGSDPGYIGSQSNDEKPFDSLQSNPYRVIVLDEFEKADQSVQRLFLPVFDEGRLVMASGMVIDFSKTIIIATTNAGREELSPSTIGFGTGQSQPLSDRSLHTALEKFFDAELLGRFTQLVGFDPLDADLYHEIIASDYDRQCKSILERKPHLAAVLPDRMDPNVLERLVADTYVPAQGARPARRAVRAWIEDTLLAASRTA